MSLGQDTGEGRSENAFASLDTMRRASSVALSVRYRRLQPVLKGARFPAAISLQSPLTAPMRPGTVGQGDGCRVSLRKGG
jgi:hypothetical protein